jgi:hypothetical protein
MDVSRCYTPRRIAGGGGEPSEGRLIVGLLEAFMAAYSDPPYGYGFLAIVAPRAAYAVIRH